MRRRFKEPLVTKEPLRERDTEGRQSVRTSSLPFKPLSLYEAAAQKVNFRLKRSFNRHSTRNGQKELAAYGAALRMHERVSLKGLCTILSK